MDQCAKLGILDDLVATGAPKLTTFRLDFDGKVIAMPIANAWGHTLSIRRTTLDPILVKHAVAAGAVVRHNTSVSGLLREGDSVVGVTVERDDGTRESHRARLVAGADGRHSQVASWVGAAPYDVVSTPSSAIYGYYENVERADASYDSMQFLAGEGVDAICGPSDGDLAAVLVIFENSHFEEVLRAGVGAFERCATSVPVLRDQMRNARLVSKLRPAGPRELDCHFRVPWGKGWALVGDAGYKEHPAAGRGIGNALRCGELLHRAVEDAWSEGKPTETYLRRYQEERDAHMRPSCEFSLRQATVNGVRSSLAEFGAAAVNMAALDAAAASN